MLTFKILVLQQLHNLSDDRIEYQIRDRLYFMRFLHLQLDHKVPDANTAWLLREKMRALNLEKVLFDRFHEQLARHGYVARAGQMIDATFVEATFVEAPRQRNPGQENAIIKADAIAIDWAQSKRRQKDVAARWAQKNGEKHYGYKHHINADQANKRL